MLLNLGSKLISGAVAAASVGVIGGGVSARMFSASAQTGDNIYQFSAKDIDGQKVDLSKYAGQVCVVVNVASKWGKTKVNYSQLVELYDKYNKTESKLAILAFPCNQFGSQEPGSNSEIKQFAAGFGVKFDMFEKIDVNGSKTHPLWEFLKEKQGGLLGSGIKWNFTKFVIDKNGNPVARLGPLDDPIPKVEAELSKYLWAFSPGPC